MNNKNYVNIKYVEIHAASKGNFWFSAPDMAMKAYTKKPSFATIFLPLGGWTTGLTGLTGRRPNEETNSYMTDQFKFVLLLTKC